MRLICGVTHSAVLAIVLLLTNCVHPQVIDPFSTGFAENEYLVIRIKDTDQLGQLYYALPEVDDKGNPLALRWHSSIKLLFPTSDTVNKVKKTKQEQVRYAFEKVSSSGKFTAASILELSANSDAAYKYESRSQGAARIDMTTLQFATPAADFIRAKLSENPECRFAYMSAIYEGTAFVEVLSNIKSAGGGNYAAFQVGGDYYVSKNRNIVISGPIIFQLTPLEPSEVYVESPIAPSVIQGGFEPLPERLLLKIKEGLPEKMQGMLE